MSDKYQVNQDRYCYPDSTVLINKANLRDQILLEQFETRQTRARVEQFSPDFEQFSLQILQKIHFSLFQDVYSWAGELRTVDISKGNTRFANVLQIEREAQSLFRALQKEAFLQGLPQTEFIQRLAHYYCELNVIHPFRDGNGRAQRLLFELLAINAGYALRWDCISAEEWLTANIAAYHGRLESLSALLQRAASPISAA